MSRYILKLVINYHPPRDGRSEAFDYMPDDLWRKILTEFIHPRCDAFGFENISTPEELKEYDWSGRLHFIWRNPYPTLHPAYIPLESYVPIDQHLRGMTVFALDLAAVYHLQYISFQSWIIDFEGNEIGELIFFRANVVCAIACPMNQTIYLSDLSSEDIQSLNSLDGRIAEYAQITEAAA